jgi:hypothetical protein
VLIRGRDCGKRRGGAAREQCACRTARQAAAAAAWRGATASQRPLAVPLRRASFAAAAARWAKRCIAAPSRHRTSPAHQLPLPSPQVSSHGSCHSRTAQVGACLSPPAHRTRMRHRRAERSSCHCWTARERQHGGRRGRDETADAPDARLAVAPLCARMLLRCPAQPSVPLIASGECLEYAQC